MKTIGALRRVDCVEAEVVLATGVYLTFRLDTTKELALRNLIEVQRRRAHMRPRESILVDAGMLQAARRGAFDAIMRHRRAMDVPERPLRKPRPPFQLVLL